MALSTKYTTDGTDIAVSPSGVSFEVVELVVDGSTASAQTEIPAGTKAIRVQSTTSNSDLDLNIELTSGGTEVNILYTLGSVISPDHEWVWPVTALDRELNTGAGEYWPQLKLNRVATNPATVRVWFHK